MDSIMTRRATLEDIAQLQEIFAIARKFMTETGNPNQWAEDYPSEELLRNDIESGDSWVVIDKGLNKIVATFVLRGGEDPTYKKINDGAWLNDGPYATIHRIAGTGDRKGILHIAVELAKMNYDNIRIDTHRDNTVMQKAILKEGFKYCGIIHCWNGDERLAFQYTMQQYPDAGVNISR